MTKFLRVIVAFIGFAGVIAATNVGIINPFSDLIILGLIASLVVFYLRKSANLGYVAAGLVVIFAAIFASMVYTNVPSTLYKSGSIVLGVSVLIMTGDLLQHWRGLARASAGRS